MPPAKQLISRIRGLWIHQRNLPPPRAYSEKSVRLALPDTTIGKLRKTAVSSPLWQSIDKTLLVCTCTTSSWRDSATFDFSVSLLHTKTIHTQKTVFVGRDRSFGPSEWEAGHRRGKKWLKFEHDASLVGTLFPEASVFIRMFVLLV